MFNWYKKRDISQERFRDIERSSLDTPHVISIVTNDLGQRSLSNFLELSWRESSEWLGILVPESVACSQQLELLSNDTRECWANESSVDGNLCTKPTRTELFVLLSSLSLCEF